MKEVVFRGSCEGCSALEIVTADAGGAPVPPGWKPIGEGSYLCPECPKLTQELSEYERDLIHATYQDAESAGEAREQWANAHLCTVCLHATVCRFRPDEEGQELLVTISRCAAFTPPMNGDPG